MRIIPDSTVTLYRNVEIDNGEQLAFSSATAQSAYFNSKVLARNTPCTMVRKTGRLRLEIAGSVAKQANYLSFVNPSFDNKVVYCRILDYDYINNECVEISYSIDYFQTWCFDVHFDDMYIEREHLSVSDWNKAEANPYDPTILEFRTAESLPVGNDVEKLNYEINRVIGDVNTKDGDLLYETSSLSVASSIKGTLIFISDIDFDALDDQADPATTTLPSVWFNDLLTVMHDATPYAAYILPTTNPPTTFFRQEYTAMLPTGSSFTGITTKMKLPYTVLYLPDSMDSNVTGLNINGLIKKLTQWGCVSSIIGMYYLPADIIASMLTVVDEGGDYEHSIQFDANTSDDRLSVSNKKLMLYPFSYLRLIAPNGDTKELHYELFEENQNGDNNCKLNISTDINGRPTMVVAPYHYKNSLNSNMIDGLIFQQIPTMPYVTDSFLAQMAANAQQIIGNNTTDFGYSVALEQLENYKRYTYAGMGGVNTAGSMLSLDFAGAATAGVDATFAGAQADLTQQRLENKFKMSDAAYNALAGQGEGNPVFENFRFTRPAYAANKYNASTGDGLINYMKSHFIDIILLHVCLNDEVLNAYDKYFTNYGYSSGRCGIPRVINFIKGISGDTNLPHWATLNNRPTTYIKTADCKVTYSMAPVAQAIKALFDNGCRFIKGDLNNV